MRELGSLPKRQLWNQPTTATSSLSPYCTPFSLPSDGVISLASDYLITLTANAVFTPQCTGATTQADGPSSVADLDDPFYGSTIPQTYVIAATTVIAWVLVVMLTITPRTFFMGSSSGSAGFSSSRGMIGGATGGTGSFVGVGSRPWLQKAAALTVAVSLTIATADTFKVARYQYDIGYMDADGMREAVEGSLEVRITRVISDIFLWLAQVQTLIRLFPRHKEKILIKWIGFALIVLDTTFSSLNSFLVNSQRRPRDYVDAIPALSYLFELAVGLLYAAWVLYYAATKRRYAFYHPRMKNISLVAFLSITAILTPVVFFVTDVTVPDVAGWGDYFRWVGAAAASVVVWEWVERIEALERDEKKDGILGREIFDGDEMLDTLPSEEVMYTRRRRDDDGSARDRGSSAGARDRHAHAKRPLSSTTHVPLANLQPMSITFGNLPRPQGSRSTTDNNSTPLIITAPPSRADTASAASTVYVVRHDGIADAPQPVRRRADVAQQHVAGTKIASYEEREASQTDKDNNHSQSQSHWRAAANPFKRKRTTPPDEVRAAMQPLSPRVSRTKDDLVPEAPSFSRWNVKGRLGAFAAERGEKLRDRSSGKREDVDLPWTIIPAQPRGAAAWSPDIISETKTTDEASTSSGTAARSRLQEQAQGSAESSGTSSALQELYHGGRAELSGTFTGRTPNASATQRVDLGRSEFGGGG